MCEEREEERRWGLAILGGIVGVVTVKNGNEACREVSIAINKVKNDFQQCNGLTCFIVEPIAACACVEGESTLLEMNFFVVSTFGT